MCVPISVATQDVEGQSVYNRGLGNYQEGNTFTLEGMASLKNAAIAFAESIASKPDLAPAYYMRGIVSLQFIHFYQRPFIDEQEQAFVEAQANFQKALQLDGELIIAYAGMGNAYDRYGSFDEAIAWYDRALEKADIIAEKWGRKALGAVYFSRGRAYHRTLKYRCIQDYEKAYECDPHLANTSMHLATAYLQAERWDEARDMATKSIQAVEEKTQKAPWDYRAYLTRAGYYAKIGTYQEEVDDLNRALGIAPFADPDILMLLGKACRDLGVEEAAGEYFDKAINTCGALIDQPNQMKPIYTFYNTRGLVWLELGRVPEAIADFQKVVELAPVQYPHAHTHYRTEGLKNLGLAYMKQRDGDIAREYLNKALALAEEQGLEFAIKDIKGLKAWN